MIKKLILATESLYFLFEEGSNKVISKEVQEKGEKEKNKKRKQEVMKIIEVAGYKITTEKTNKIIGQILVSIPEDFHKLVRLKIRSNLSKQLTELWSDITVEDLKIDVLINGFKFKYKKASINAEALNIYQIISDATKTTFSERYSVPIRRSFYRILPELTEELKKQAWYLVSIEGSELKIVEEATEEVVKVFGTKEYSFEDLRMFIMHTIEKISTAQKVSLDDIEYILIDKMMYKLREKIPENFIEEIY